VSAQHLGCHVVPKADLGGRTSWNWIMTVSWLMRSMMFESLDA
jgi:hypothetical protein